MTRWHIKKDGTPGICHAKRGKCPLGGVTGNENHFKTQAEAQAAADMQNASNFKEEDMHYGHGGRGERKWNERLPRYFKERNDALAKHYEDLYMNSKNIRRPEDMTDPEELRQYFISEGAYRDVTAEEIASYPLSDKMRPIRFHEDRDLHNGGYADTNRYNHDLWHIHQFLTPNQRKFADTVYRSHVNDRLKDEITSVYNSDINSGTGQINVLFDYATSDNETFADATKHFKKNSGPGNNPDDSNEYINTLATVYNVEHSKGNKDFHYNTKLLAMQSNSVQRGDIELKLMAADPEDIKADCGTFAAARKYATEVEGMNIDEVSEVMKKGGLVNHFRDRAGLTARETSNIERTNLAIFSKTTGIDTSNRRPKDKELIAEYAMNKPMKEWDPKAIDKAIKDNPKDHMAITGDMMLKYSKYDTIRTELGMYPRHPINTAAFTRDELTKFKLWDVQGPLFRKDSRIGIHQGYLKRDKKNPFIIHDTQTGKRYVPYFYEQTKDEKNYIMKHFYGVDK